LYAQNNELISLSHSNFPRLHAIRYDQQNTEKAARHIHGTNQSSSSSKRDKVKKVSALINELQIQDSTNSDEELDALKPYKNHNCLQISTSAA
jgi:hypothetical protein